MSGDMDTFGDSDSNTESIDNKERFAIDLSEVFFGYNKTIDIIKNITIRIGEGKIYALLGSNGCGKTTVLRLILGRLRPKCGSIRVFGHQPGGPDSDIPGKGVGYMPQDIALFNEFSVRETLSYFGNIFDMTSEDITNRVNELTQLLSLDKIGSKIRELSGGEQRLVSMAVSLIHSPKLLILDEPTIGVDSIIRYRVWKHLESLRNDGITIIITTHYIEEAKGVSTVGFLRSGRLLVESNPIELINKYNSKRLEEVFFKLCQKNKKKKKKSIFDESDETYDTEEQQQIVEKINVDANERKTSIKYKSSANNNSFIKWKRIKALIKKQYIRVVRNPVLIYSFYILPIIQVILIGYTMGANPKNLPVAIYNGESNPDHSKLFLDSIETGLLIPTYYTSNESAIDSLYKGQNWISIAFSENFSDNFEARYVSPAYLADDEFEMSKIRVTEDRSNRIIYQSIERYLLQAFQKFLITFSEKVGRNPKLFSAPIDAQKPVYGVMEQSLTDYVSPGMTMAIIHFLPLVVSGFLLLIERKYGYCERDFVAGVKPHELWISYIVFNFIAIVSQVLLTMIVAFAILGSTLKGRAIDALIIMTIQGMQGMSIGLFISLMLTTEITVIGGILGLVFPLWVTSGMFWPTEAIEDFFAPISLWNPLTKNIESLRSITMRGWGLGHSQVLTGIGVCMTYTVVLSVINCILFNKQSSRVILKMKS